MNQRTQGSLTGWASIATVVAMSALATTQIITAQAQIRQIFHNAKDRRLKKIYDKFNEEKKRITDGVVPKFEFWWVETGKKIVKDNPNLLESVGFPLDFDLSQLPESKQREVMDEAESRVSHRALDFAIHLANQPTHDVLVQEVQRVDRKLAEGYRAQHEAYDTEHRTALTELGIDIDAFAREFSAT